MLFSRRRFLCGATASAMSMPLFMRALEADAATDTILVTILQDGGCDGFNTVVPLAQYGKYSDLRTVPGGGSLAVLQSDIATTGTAFDANYLTPANQAVSYALHPQMTALRALYGQGKVAVLMGVGIPPADPSRTSHEVGKFDWATGSINKLGYTNIGWIGQAFDTIGGSGALPPAASVNYQSPTLLRGRKTSPLVIGGDLSSFTLPCGSGGADCATRVGALNANDTFPSPANPAEFARALSSTTAGFVGVVQQYAAAAPGADYPSTTGSSIKSQLKQIARLIAAGAPTRAFYASQGGYDTHSAQNGPGHHPDLVGELSDAISQFYTYLQGKSLSQRVVIMTMTDFGRRPQANSTAGTDHGTASVSFVIGDRVKGGVYGQYPNLSSLDNNGNVVIQVDFRNHISDLVTALGTDPVPIVGSSYPKLGFI
jgi:uncharacterized protein (DUF1501 family)